MTSSIKESCGVFGVMNHEKAARLVVFGLFSLQHRGEEACGVVSCDGNRFHQHLCMGRVSESFDENIIRSLSGTTAIGHTRYSVTGTPGPKNIQPIVVRHIKGQIAVSHNGNLTNALELRRKLEKEGAIFQSTMDSEIILHLIVKSKKKTIRESIIDAARHLKGAYSLLIMTEEEIFALRDPWGFRPLCLGQINDGKTTVVASETCALDLIQARYMGQVDPGEMVSIRKEQPWLREHVIPKEKMAACIFEMVYFSRPDSLVFGQSVYQFRRKAGAILAREAPVEADMVVPIPDSGTPPALGYAEATRLPLEMGITRNHYVGRSFIQPTQGRRESLARIKLNPIKNIIYNKRIVIVDDSIVRGTTTRERIRSLREAGIREVHMRIACPPIRHACHFGIDFPDPEKLIANRMSIEEIKQYLNLDSLAYLSLEGLLKAGEGKNYFCHACYSGDYPYLAAETSKETLEEQS